MALRLAAGQPRTLAYSDDIRKDLRLLEVDEGLLNELLQTGLCLQGAPGEEAVLCSGSKTFAVKNVETTNLVLLVQEEREAAVAAPVEVLGSQDANVAPQPTPPGVLLGLGTQLHKNQAAAQRAPVVASALVGSHLELVPAAPRLHQLDALLQEHPYGADGSDEAAGEGMETDGEPGSSGAAGGSFRGGYTERELLERVQCSVGELRAALEDRKALCMGGRYCCVDGGYLGVLLELALLTAAEHGWPLSALPGERLAAALQPHGYDPHVTLHCLATYGSPAGGSTGGTALTDGGEVAGAPASAMETEEAADRTGGEAGSGTGSSYFCLDEAAVCLYFARSLLQAQPDWELEEFEREWQHRVPEGMLPSLEMLRGEVRLYGGGTAAAGLPQPRRIKHFPLSALPRDAPSRFAALFAEQQRWEWEELAPYVQGLQGPGQTAEALLLKYARASQQRPTDPVTYSAR